MSHCQLTHSTSDHLNSNHASVVTARNCFPFRNVRYNWSKSLHGVYLAKNNQTKTIWSAGMLFVDANENMFKVINMKDLHNFRRNYSWKKLRDWTISFRTLNFWASVAPWTTPALPFYSQHFMIYSVAPPAFCLISDGENWACLFQPCCCMYIM